MSNIQFENVSKRYGDEVAVEGFSLDIEDGEFLTIVGPSGSGKSTLLRMVAGLEDISGGEIRIGNDRVNETPPQHRGVAMVFQNYALYPHMSVRKNMTYGLKLTSDLSEEEIDERVEEAAVMMGIEDLLDQKPANLSGGQQQRVATGRAIVREPRAFLMDEPLSNLDAKLRVHMRTELQRIQEDLDTTTIYVTHDQEEALTMSDRVVILNAGELQQVGTPDQVYSQPANRFVADFIGSPSMNFFDVRLDGETLVGNGFEYPISSGIVRRLEDESDSGEFVLGIRPEDISLGDGKSPIRARVDVVEPVGSDNYVYLDIGGDDCTVRVPADVKPEEGSDVGVEFEEENIHVFDRATDRNLLVTSQTPASTPDRPVGSEGETA